MQAAARSSRDAVTNVFMFVMLQSSWFFLVWVFLEFFIQFHYKWNFGFCFKTHITDWMCFWPCSCFCHEAYFFLWGVARQMLFLRHPMLHWWKEVLGAGGTYLAWPGSEECFCSWAVSILGCLPLMDCASHLVPGNLISCYVPSKNELCVMCLVSRQ